MVQVTPRKHVNAVRQRKSRLQNSQQLFSVPPKPIRKENVDSSCQGTCYRSFHEYFLNATLHGLKYISDSSISLFERYETNRRNEETFISLHFFLYFPKHILWFDVRHCDVAVSVFYIEHSHKIHIKADDHFAQSNVSRYKISSIPW